MLVSMDLTQVAFSLMTRLREVCALMRNKVLSTDLVLLLKALRRSSPFCNFVAAQAAE